MLLTFRNASSELLHVSSMYIQIAPGATVQTNMSFADIDHDVHLKALLQAGTLTITDITMEPGDSFGIMASPSLSFTNLTRPLPTALPPLTSIWNSDDNAMNWTDGANWRDAMGNIT
jgi:hypothetical protein